MGPCTHLDEESVCESHVANMRVVAMLFEGVTRQRWYVNEKEEGMCEQNPFSQFPLRRPTKTKLTSLRRFRAGARLFWTGQFCGIRAGDGDGT